MCQGLNSHYFRIIGNGHQPNSRGLYTHYKDSVIKGGMTIPNIATFDHGTYVHIHHYVVTHFFSTLEVSACEKCGQWQAALQVLNDLYDRNWIPKKHKKRLEMDR